MADDARIGTVDWGLRRTQIAKRQQRAFVDRVRLGHGDLAPEGAMENDARVYTDETRLTRELETVFRAFPILAGLSNDVPDPGSIMLFEELGQSIIIVRNKMGEVRAYLNMCTHRSMQLVDAPCKKARFTCPFHGWTYDLNGKLIGVPEPEAFENIERSTRGLKPVPVKEWAGMIFILPHAGDDEIDLEAHLEDFAVELQQLELWKAQPVKSGTMEADCNWKYALDTYGEAYHFPVLHRDTVALYNTTESYHETFGRHSRIAWPTTEIKDLLDRPESDWPEPSYGGVHYLFPNTILFYGSVGAQEPFVQIFRHFPDGAHAMRTQFSVYSRDVITSEEDRTFIETAGYDGTAHVVETEDYWVAAKGYEQLRRAPEGFKVIYGANELSLQHKHEELATATGMPLEAESE